ncbi:hypothetical protein TNCV_2834161 [Trichonephila clavipes]|nr:hypothetical protein TNCV_2834161 [Trichonephila clavipes]
MLSETWLDNDEPVTIPNFDCCLQFKRPGRRAAGVAIYRKQKNSYVVTPHMNIIYHQTSGLGIEHFGKRNLPGKRSRRHFSQLTQAGRRAVLLARWIVGSVPLEMLGAVHPRRYPRVENRVWSDQEDHEERRSKDDVASTCGPHSDSFNDTSRHRRSNCSTNNFQTSCKSKS